MTNENKNESQETIDEPLYPAQDNKEKEIDLDKNPGQISKEDIINLGDVDEIADKEDSEIMKETSNFKKSDSAEAEGQAYKKRESTDPAISLPPNQVDLIKQLAESITRNARQLADLLAAYGGDAPAKKAKLGFDRPAAEQAEQNEGQVIEGIFNGEKMIGPDGKEYNVPVNYASKSKLVEGDRLKLTITPSGTFIYKQIMPVERKRLVGVLEETDGGEFFVKVDDKRYKVLTASVTYYKGQSGDETVIIVPKVGNTKWAAVENIVN